MSRVPRTDRDVFGFWFWLLVGGPILAATAVERFFREEWGAWRGRRGLLP